MSKTLKSKCKLKNLTCGEILYITRRRMKETQVQVAADCNITRNAYRLLEANEEIAPKSAVFYKYGAPLTVGECCVLYRRRSGWTTEKVAKKMKCCKYWLRLMENDEAPNSELLDFWTATCWPKKK